MASSASEVFVSYKAEDRSRLAPLVKALGAEGFTVWWDAHIGGGTDWRDEIQQHLDAARCVIVAWSERSVGPEGRFVRDEASAAQQAGSYVPIKIDAVKPPLGFGEVQAIDFVGWKGKRAAPCFVALVLAVDGHLSGEAPIVRQATLANPEVSRRNVMAGAAGALAIAGVGGWALLKPGAAAASNRIAVMSFSNLSGDPGQAYFSDGIAEELRSALSRVGMQVIGKASSDAVKSLDTQAAAAKLGVANILSGSVRRSPDTVRVGAQLVNGKDGVEKWAQNYDRAPGDTIKIQSDIAAQVASALSIALGVAKKAALTAGGTADVRAQDLYLQAEALFNSADNAESYRGATALYDAAIASDPNYGEAHLGRANVLTRYAIRYEISPAALADTLKRAEQSVRRAAALMPRSGRPAAMFAEICADRLDFVAALAGSKQAIKAEPNDSFVLQMALRNLPWLGDRAQAVALANRLIALDPLNSSAFSARANSLYVLRRYAEVIDVNTKALAFAPQRNNPRLGISHSLILLNHSDEARPVLAQMPADDSFRQTDEAIIAARRGDRRGAEAIVAKIRDAEGDADSYQYGQIYCQLGDADRAFVAFEKGIEVRDPGLSHFKRDPFLDPIRRDPRYAALLTRLKFPT